MVGPPQRHCYLKGRPASNGRGQRTPGTKRALIIELLSREEGASIGDLTAATG